MAEMQEIGCGHSKVSIVQYLHITVFHSYGEVLFQAFWRVLSKYLVA